MINEEILNTVELELKNLCKNGVCDLRLFYHLCWFIGNVSVTSAEIAETVLNKTSILETIQ